LLELIRARTVIQNPHILFCTKWNDTKCCFLVAKESGEICMIWQRFGDTVYEGTIFEGCFLIDDKFYATLSWTIEKFVLPPVPQLADDTSLPGFSLQDPLQDPVDTTDTTDQKEFPTTVTDAEIKAPATELVTADSFMKARMPRQAKREIMCKFYIRMLYQLCGVIYESRTATYDMTVKLNHALTVLFEHDTIFNNCSIISWLDQVWAYECDLTRSHLNTVLYKPIPYGLLHAGLVEERMKANLLISSTINFARFANFVLRYYGPDKPCVYNLLAFDDSGRLVVFDTAHVPTVECQQYIVCVLRKQGNQTSVVRCVLETKLMRWIPVHHLMKPETKVVTVSFVQKLMSAK